MPAVQAFQALFQETSTPKADRGLTTAQSLGDRPIRDPIGQKQDQPGTLGIRGTEAACPRPSCQFLSLFIGKDDSLGRGVHECIISPVLQK